MTKVGRLGVGLRAVILMTGPGIAVLFFYYRPTIGNFGARFSSLYSICAD
jgi:hypothetical protein